MLGASLGPAGDVDGDGYADVIVGASHYSYSIIRQGIALVTVHRAKIGGGRRLDAAQQVEDPGERNVGGHDQRQIASHGGQPRQRRVARRIEPGPGCRLTRRGFAAFANTYRFLDPPPGWSVALADHGGPFVASIERDAVLACQFHPELSGPWGLELLRCWMTAAEVTAC